MLLLCRDHLVSLCAKNIQHIAQRGKNAALKHVENSRTATTDQRNTLLVLGYRLLLVTALDIPENDLSPIQLMDVVSVAQERFERTVKQCNMGEYRAREYWDQYGEEEIEEPIDEFAADEQEQRRIAKQRTEE